MPCNVGTFTPRVSQTRRSRPMFPSNLFEITKAHHFIRTIYIYLRTVHVLLSSPFCPGAMWRRQTASLALQLVLFDIEGHVQQLLLLLGVRCLQTRGNRGAGTAAGVHDVLAIVVFSLVQQRLDAGLREAPGPGVERLLLGPDDSVGVRVHVQILPQLLPREGIELLNASDGYVVDLVVVAVLVQRNVDLPRAQYHTLDLVRLLEGSSLVAGVWDDPAELRIAREVPDVGAGDGMPQQRLGEEDDER